MTELLRAALSEAESLAAVERATGVTRQSMTRFMRGKQSLRLDLGDKLAEHFGVRITDPPPNRIRAWQVKRECRIDEPEVVNLLELMTAQEVLRDTFHWIILTSEDPHPIRKTNLLVAFNTACLWSWETIRLLRKGKKKGWLSLNMAGDQKKTFTTLTCKRPPSAVKKMEDVRNLTSAHLDRRLVQKFLEGYEHNRDDMPPFFETASAGQLAGQLFESRYPWAYEVLGGLLYDFPFDKDAMQSELESLRRIMASVIKLLQQLIPALADQAGLKWEPMNKPTESENK